jgi:23S rRNA A2030 N6-methylase RlmJ
MSQVVVRRSISRVPEDPEAFWLNRLDSDTVPVAKSNFRRWMRWLRSKQGWETVTPREMLIRQLQAEDQYVLLDLVQEFIESLVARKSSKEKTHWAVTSFFRHNRCALPSDPSFKIRGDRPPVEGRLSVSDVIEAYHAATVRYKSIILFQWQPMLDNSRLIWMNRNKADQVVKQIQEGVHPVRVDMPGRKENENDGRGHYYTFIGKDAVDALVKYFE